MKTLKKIIIAIFIVPIISLTVLGDEILDLYKHLHANPELSWQEYKTSDLLAEKMEELGFSVTKGFAKTGVVSIYKNGKGPVLMIRADMDGLPVQEKTGLKYASKVRSLYTDKSEVYVMHACGHDVHMAVAIGTAKELLRNKNKWAGTLMVIFQPAEERGQGSARMLEEGLFEKFPRPDYNLALHVGSTLPAGTVAYHKGYAMANVDMADITIFGVGGHGAYPHTAKDPIVLASKIVLALQTIVSREIDPLNPAVVTVGSIHGGFKHNIISDEVKLQLTLRSYTDEVREKIISKIERIIRGEAISMGISEDKMPTLKLRDEYTPALYNTPEFVDIVIKHIKDSIGENNVFEVPPVMGGEDFGRFGRVEPKIPTFLFWIGGPSLLDWEKSEKGEISIPGNHSPLFAPDPEPTLKTGVSAMTAAAIGVFNEPR
ncbi:uncharacterized protein METZ01_LOCUS27328 [marine metagenome]|uniref:Peptidase M20 dimerisation domain-containing protein n=1 Tax=marine metagenome TaxID=408172 RepID=A0A381Q6I1_9ZZZZ